MHTLKLGSPDFVDYTVQLRSDKDRVKFVKRIEKIVRSSQEYKDYIAYLKENVDMTNMVARQITPHDFETFDWIIGMDQENVEELKRRAPRSAQEKIHLFLSSIPGKEKENVPDPYYTNNFDETYHLITEGLNHWWNIWIDENKITNNL